MSPEEESAAESLKVTAVAPWYGSNRMLADRVGEALAGCKWVGVPFAGGMSELARIKARTILVSDLHRHVINLARVIADPKGVAVLRDKVDAVALHPDALAAAQERCRLRENGDWVGPDDEVDWAADYFVTAWMARNGAAGTDREFDAGISVRYHSEGGDSAVRFRNAASSLVEWSTLMRRCTFVVSDVFEFLAKCHDRPDNGLYLDPPFPGPGDKYRHKFGPDQHRRLADALLAEFDRTRVVCRFYDTPLVRELYPEPAWTWTLLTGRKATNELAAEALIVRNGPASPPASTPSRT